MSVWVRLDSSLSIYEIEAREGEAYSERCSLEMAHFIGKHPSRFPVRLDRLSESSVVLVVGSKDEGSDSISNLDMFDVRSDSENGATGIAPHDEGSLGESARVRESSSIGRVESDSDSLVL